MSDRLPMKQLRTGILACALLAHAGPLLAQQYECILEPEMDSELGSGAPGIIESVSVRRGDRVEQGQVVARLVSGAEQAAVDVARARVEATSQIESAEIRKAYSERQYQRTIELSEKKYASDADLDQVRTDMVLAEKDLLEARDAMVLARAELRRAQELLELKRVKSPFDGVVVDRYHDPGERVEDQAIIKVAKINPLYVETLLPVEMIGAVQVGETGLVTTEFDTDQVYEARVVVVDTVVDAASGLFGVRLELPNPDLRIAAGLECNVAFQGVNEPAEPVE